MPGTVRISKVKTFRRTITFDGTTYGAVGALTIASVTGRVLIERLSIPGTYLQPLEDGDNDDATIELGTANNTAALVDQTTATDMDGLDFWTGATPSRDIGSAFVDKVVASDIILTIGTRAIVSGQLTFDMEWRPMSLVGNIKLP